MKAIELILESSTIDGNYKRRARIKSARRLMNALVFTLAPFSGAFLNLGNQSVELSVKASEAIAIQDRFRSSLNKISL